MARSTATAVAAAATSRRRTRALKPLSRPPLFGEGEEADGCSDYGDISCVSCRSGDSPAELLLRDKCDRGFHLFCLRPILASVPKGTWFCSNCSG